MRGSKAARKEDMMEGQRFGLATPMPYDRQVLWVLLRVLPGAIARINSTSIDKRNASTLLADLRLSVDNFDLAHELPKVGWGDSFSLDQHRQMDFLLMYLESAVEDNLKGHMGDSHSS